MTEQGYKEIKRVAKISGALLAIVVVVVYSIVELDSWFDNRELVNKVHKQTVQLQGLQEMLKFQVLGDGEEKVSLDAGIDELGVGSLGTGSLGVGSLGAGSLGTGSLDIGSLAGDTVQALVVDKRDPNIQQNPNKPKAAMVLFVSSLDEINYIPDTIESYQRQFNNKFQYDWIVVSLKSYIKSQKPIIDKLVANVRYVDLKVQSYNHITSNLHAREIGDTVDVYPRKFKSRSMIRQKHLTRFLLSELFQVEQVWKDYKYYWRVPIGSELGCDVDYDVFEIMEKENIQYGWLLIHHDIQGPQPEFTSKLQEFSIDLDQFNQNKNDWKFEDCSIDPDFEIVNIEFLKSAKYQAFFDFLNKNEMIYYKGWREPIIKTAAVSLLLESFEVKFFHDLPVVDHLYGLLNCPTNPSVYQKNKCICDPYMKDSKFSLSLGSRDYEVMHDSVCVNKWLEKYSQAETDVLDIVEGLVADVYRKDPEFGQLFGVE